MLPGLVLTAAGLLLMSLLGEHSSYFPLMFFALLILGLGAGLAFIPLLAIAMANVPGKDAGLASGIVNVSLQMSGALGLAILGTISTDHARSLQAGGDDLPTALTGGYELAFLVGAALRRARRGARVCAPANAAATARAGLGSRCRAPAPGGSSPRSPSRFGCPRRGQYHGVRPLRGR